jgi:cytochrome b
MKDLVNLWPIGLIVLILIITLVWGWLDEKEAKKEVNFKKIWYNKINYIPEDKLLDEGLSPKEKKSFNK